MGDAQSKEQTAAAIPLPPRSCIETWLISFANARVIQFGCAIHHNSIYYLITFALAFRLAGKIEDANQTGTCN